MYLLSMHLTFFLNAMKSLSLSFYENAIQPLLSFSANYTKIACMYHFVFF